jgi:hypothetical protein
MDNFTYKFDEATASQAQIDANRLNAQKSTGPVTDAGKAASSQNRAYHRLTQYADFQLLEHEDPAGFNRLLRDLLAQFYIEDNNKAERAIVERMAEHEWMRRRALLFQAGILHDDQFFSRKQMALFMRYESQHERAYNSCFNQLLKLRAERRSEKIGFEREKQLCQQVEERKHRHEINIKARQVDIDCKIVRTLRTAANNQEALDLARKVQTRHQAA